MCEMYELFKLWMYKMSWKTFFYSDIVIFFYLGDGKCEMVCLYTHSQSLPLLDCLSRIVFAVPLECYDQLSGFTQGLARFSIMTAGVNNLCSATNLAGRPSLTLDWYYYINFNCILN